MSVGGSEAGSVCSEARRFLHWGEWIPFAGASLYLLWELGRVSSALAELASLWNGQYAKQEEAERDEYYRKRREQRDKP